MHRIFHVYSVKLNFFSILFYLFFFVFARLNENTRHQSTTALVLDHRTDIVLLLFT